MQGGEGGQVIGGRLLEADEGVLLGYPPGRVATTALHLGARARLRSGTVLYAGSTIGDDLQTGHGVVIREQSTIGHGVSVWSNALVDYGCVIGDRVKIHANCYVSQYTVIEDDAFLAPGTTFANDLYPGLESSAEVMAGPTICAGAQLGVNTTVLPYVVIGAGAVIGAGSVVTRDVPPGMVAYGNPAVVVHAVDELRPIGERVVGGGDDHPGRRRLRPASPA